MISAAWRGLYRTTILSKASSKRVRLAVVHAASTVVFFVPLTGQPAFCPNLHESRRAAAHEGGRQLATERDTETFHISTCMKGMACCCKLSRMP